jgi:hypothetical protein
MKNKGKVLAEGEATGHAHRLQHTEVYEAAPNYLTFEVIRDDEFVSHEEHKPIPVARGKRAAGVVMEYDHFEEESRRVVD